jgi:polyisoprenoid-binding protein YceI
MRSVTSWLGARRTGHDVQLGGFAVKRYFVLAALLLANANAQLHAQAAPETWTIDPNHTAAQFAVRHLLVSTVRGQFEKLDGTIQMVGNDIRSISVNVTIDVASVNTRVERRDNDLRSANFFDVAQYPTITFVSRRVEPGEPGKFKLVGDLTIHGVTREVVLDVEGPTPALNQGQRQRIGASATTRINRRDFGLHYNAMVEAAPVVGDEITITIDVEATRPRGGAQ